MNAKGVDTIEKLAMMIAEGFADVDARFDAVDARFDKQDVEIAAIRSEISEIKADLAVLKEKVANHEGHTKEIDHALSRIANIEQRLETAGV